MRVSVKTMVLPDSGLAVTIVPDDETVLPIGSIEAVVELLKEKYDVRVDRIGYGAAEGLGLVDVNGRKIKIVFDHPFGIDIMPQTESDEEIVRDIGEFLENRIPNQWRGAE